MARVWLVARGRGCGPVRSLQGGAAGRRVPGRQPGLAAQRPPQAHIRANFEPNFARRVFGCLRPAPHGASCKVSVFVRQQCIISLVIDTALPELHERHVACGADRPELQGDSCTPTRIPSTHSSVLCALLMRECSLSTSHVLMLLLVHTSVPELCECLPQAHIRANSEPNFARRVFGCLRPVPHGASCKVSFFVRPQCIISLVIDTALPELHERHVACGADRPELQGDSCTPALNHAHAQGSCHSTTDHQRSGHPHSASLPQHRARTNPHGAYCTPGLWDGS